jgi:DNA repair exonuclease SbcCD nuclease subunit
MSKTPLAVIINDLHFNINTLDIAEKALHMAASKAEILEVPLIIAGDLHDTKANIRAECQRSIQQVLYHTQVRTWILRGNHDSINEKSDVFALNLTDAMVISDRGFSIASPSLCGEFNKIRLIPYQHNPEIFAHEIGLCEPESLVIMHQGVIGANMGEYIQDKSAVDKNLFKNLRVISGHYHARQDIQTGSELSYAMSHHQLGTISYTGNPYTLTFGEANDPEKGFHVLNTDGSLEFIPTNLRKHVVYKTTVADLSKCPKVRAEDLIWIRITDYKDNLRNLKKEKIAERAGLPTANFKVDTALLDAPKKYVQGFTSQPILLDTMIDGLDGTTTADKEAVKALWKDFLK